MFDPVIEDRNDPRTLAAGRERQQDCFRAARDADRREARGADAAGDVHRRREAIAFPIVKALGTPIRKVAVSDKRTIAGDADLATVRVAGEDQVRSGLGEVVQHALVRSVNDGHLQVGAGVLVDRTSGPTGITFTAQVRIINAREIEPQARSAPLTGHGW